MKLSLKMKKSILFAALFVAWLVADIASKRWADSNLANRSHPIPLRVGDAAAGRSLGDFLKDELGWDDAEVAARLATEVELLEPAGDFGPTDRPFDKAQRASGLMGFYVSWRGPEHAPRRIRANDWGLVTRWLRLAFPEASADKLRASVDGLLGELTLSEWLPTKFLKFDAEMISALAATGIHPIHRGAAALEVTRKIHAGETYLLVHNQIDVMGDWFKLLYAENPGAAFGFMKGVPASTRFTLFTILTLLAFIVILFIVYRLPAEGWFIYAAFAGILAGAAGNLVDRLSFRYVIDFIDMDLGFMHWPTYNIADISISLGVVALVLNITFDKNSPLVSDKDKQRRAEKGERRAAL